MLLHEDEQLWEMSIPLIKSIILKALLFNKVTNSMPSPAQYKIKLVWLKQWLRRHLLNKTFYLTIPVLSNETILYVLQTDFLKNSQENILNKNNLQKRN